MSQYIPQSPYQERVWPGYDQFTVYHTYPSSTDYPESSQRTILSSSPDNIDAGVLHPIYDHRRSHSSHSSDYNHSTLWDANTLPVDYQDQQMHPEDAQEAILETLPQSSDSRQTSPAPSLHPTVKVEPDDPDGCFIMELSSMSPSVALSVTGMNHILAPPTEVPLRATQASKEMRKMMGVFRLNPFAMHSGEGRGVMPALWCGGGPLEEEPLIFEFQLDIDDDSLNRQFDHSGASGSTTTNLLGTEEQLRSFSPSFELHPEDLRSDMGGEEHEQEQEERTDPDQQNEWSDLDCGNQSEVDTSSTSHSVHTPSETRSAHNTPFNESSVYQYPITPTWDIDSYQAHGEEHLPPAEKMEGGHKMHRVHTASHPYLRRSLVNHQATSPSSSTHSLSQSHTHLHTQSQLNFGYPLLQHPTTHHQHQHYNNQVPDQNHNSQQSYPQHPNVHDSMISSPLELIPVPSHRPQISMYSSYMRSEGRTLKLAEDEPNPLHHHPAGIVNEYIPRGTADSHAYTSQHDTHTSLSGHHQYEHSNSTGGHALSPSRRWSLPETIGGPFRSTM